MCPMLLLVAACLAEPVSADQVRVAVEGALPALTACQPPPGHFGLAMRLSSGQVTELVDADGAAKPFDACVADVIGALGVPEVDGDFELRLGVDATGVQVESVSTLARAADGQRPVLPPRHAVETWPPYLNLSRYQRAAASVAPALQACRDAAGLDPRSAGSRERYWISGEGQARLVIDDPSRAERKLQRCFDEAFSHAALQPDPNSPGWIIGSFPLTR